MKHYLNLVSISDKVHRRQSRMTRICIILAVFLVAVMFGLADMYLQSMTAETKHQTGDWHAKFSAIDEETSALIAARPETELSGWQGTIKTDEPRTLDFSGVRGFLVTNMFIVQCSVAYNVHRSEPPLLTFQRP